MPLLVASNERAAGLHTFEEAKDLWNEFLGHLSVTEAQIEETNDSDDSDSDQNDYLLGGANGVGESVSEQIREYIVEERMTVDWREHVDPEDSGWYDDVEQETQGMPSPDKVMELMDSGWTKQEIQDFYAE